MKSVLQISVAEGELLFFAGNNFVRGNIFKLEFYLFSMKIGLIGPNTMRGASEKELEERKILLSSVAKILSKTKNELVLTPDKGSLLEFFGNKYKEFGGGKILIIAPMKDDAEEYLNLEIGEIVDCEMWYRQPSKFSEETDLFVCVGYTAGVLSEIGASQYFNPKKIFVIEEFVSSKLPSEINKSMNIEYISIKSLDDKLNSFCSAS